jgi:hypothetical protein
MRGVLRWPQLDSLWQSLKPKNGWYLYEVGGDPPKTSINGDKLRQAIEIVDAFLREQHEADYCGVVYTDDLDTPSLLKVYHPKKMGLRVAAAVQPCFPNGSCPGSPRWTWSSGRSSRTINQHGGITCCDGVASRSPMVMPTPLFFRQSRRVYRVREWSLL